MKIKNTLWLATGMLALGMVAIGQAETQKVPTEAANAKFTKVAQLMEDKCMACHTKDFELPFYAKIPGIKGIIEQDYNDGLRAFDLNAELLGRPVAAPVSEPALAKMEWVVLNNTMPPAKFTAVHWGSRLSREDEDSILDWVKTSRATHYATGKAAPDKVNEPIQPLADVQKTNPAKVILGEALFNDKRLSADSTVACATCHLLDRGGVDGLRFSEGIAKQVGDVNAPTVYNAVNNVSQFWNGRAADLQEQAGGPPMNPIEMGSKDWNEIIGRLATDAALTAQFTAVYPQGWTGDNITDAIAEYEKTLLTPDSRFDKWLMGDAAALTSPELEGYARFKAYRCASCHVGQNVGGQSFEYMDLKKPYFEDRGNPLGSDAGLTAFTTKLEDIHRFKVPGLRNIELTAPYLHDGTATTLDDSIRIMGTYLSGLEVPPSDRELITAFLRTLTGTYKGQPVGGQPVVK